MNTSTNANTRENVKPEQNQPYIRRYTLGEYYHTARAVDRAVATFRVNMLYADGDEDEEETGSYFFLLMKFYVTDATAQPLS
jgi:hypothetical protein